MTVPQEFFYLLSDETRLRCLLLLQNQKEICVCEFSKILDAIQPKISRHLALLRQSGLVIDERRGQWIYYRLSEKLENWKKQLLADILTGLNRLEPYNSDSAKLSAIREKDCCKSN